MCLFTLQPKFLSLKKSFLGNLFPLGTYYAGHWGWRKRNWNIRCCGKKREGEEKSRNIVWSEVLCCQELFEFQTLWTLNYKLNKFFVFYEVGSITGAKRMAMLFSISVLTSSTRAEKLTCLFSLFLSKHYYKPEPVLKTKHRKEEELKKLIWREETQVSLCLGRHMVT